MSYRVLQLSPRTSTRGFEATTPVRDRRISPLGGSPDAQFLLSWFEEDELDRAYARGGMNWGVISGLAFAVGVSAISWVGLGWIVAHVWR